MPHAVQRTPQSRVFIIENGAGPANIPVYEGLARAMAVSFPQGDVTPFHKPSKTIYGDFDVAGKIRGQQGLPTLPIQFYMEEGLSDILAILQRRCDLDIQVHFGVCKTPDDFDFGWNKIIVLETAVGTDYGTTELGALDSSQEAVINEDVSFTGLAYYEIVPLTPEELAPTELTDEAIDVVICDSITCGECGLPSDGCQRVFVLTTGTAGSPGLQAELVFTDDGGETFSETTITTLGLANNPNAMACVGTNLVVVSNDSDSLHYAPIADILAGTETWTEMAVGFVAAGSPNEIFSLGRTKTWIVGDGGFVYFSEDITTSVVVQTAGTVTTEVLNDIHGSDEDNLVAVGASNAVIVTTNGGETWIAVTGPNVGTALNTVWMRTPLEWLVGDAGGQLWYTRDGGVSWTEKTFPGSGSGVVRNITFATPTVGFMAHDTTDTLGRVLSTVNGGQSWVVEPRDTGKTFPLNDQINKIAACVDDVNVAFAAGLGDDGTDGFLAKLA